MSRLEFGVNLLQNFLRYFTERRRQCTMFKENVTDDEVADIIAHFIRAAELAQDAGFDFVDVKLAHGYLGHEFLTAYDRPGPFGGSFENRTRFFREIMFSPFSQKA